MSRDKQRRFRGRITRLLLLVVLAAVALATAAVWVWRQRGSVDPGAGFTSGRSGLGEVGAAGDPAALPDLPDLAGRPTSFTKRLVQADARAKSPQALLEGCEELGKLYQSNGYNDEAEACWRILRVHQPGEARWCYRLAVLRLAAGDADEAMSLLRETLELAPGYSPAILQRAELQFKTGDFDGAARDYQRRLELVPRDPYARLGLVRIALQERRSAEARTLIEELVQDAPNFSTAHNLYAQILEADGDERRAKWHRWLGVETLRYVAPQDPWLDELQSWCYDYNRLCVLGSVEALRENHHGAQALYERAIGIDPTRLDAYQLLAGLHFEDARPDDARAVLERAKSVATEKDLTPLFTDLCRAHRELGQPEAALRLAREGLTKREGSPELLEALGLALADLERHSDAVEAYRTALARKPNDASINYNLAVSLLALRRLDEVLAALDRSLVLQPTFPPAMLLRGRFEMAAGHWDRAEDYLRPVYESHRQNAEARRLFAEWHWQRGADAEKKDDEVEAERHYREAASIDPDHANVRVSLGLFLLVRSRFADAIEPLEIYHHLQPDSAPGCLFLGQAYAAVGRKHEARDVLTRGAELADRTKNAKTADACRDILRDL